MNCPRCAAPLQAHTTEGTPSHRCDACDGLLLAQRNLVTLLDGLIRQLKDVIDLEIPPELHDDPHGIASCPQCSKAMVRFGYMESRMLTLDRCPDCWLLWFDAGELLTAVQMRARTEHMALQHERSRDEMAARMSAIWRASANRGVN